MIPYHGSPLGGPINGAISFFQGRHGLVSHAHPRQLDIIVEVCQSFILDNGAFSQWRKGKLMDVNNYMLWVKKWYRHPGFDWALIPDIIDGDEKSNDALLELWLNEMPKPTNIGVPVWHLHESFRRLETLIRSWPTVALGSSGEWKHPGSKIWWKRMTQVMGVVCTARGTPKTRLHGLRMMNPKIFNQIPFSSVDSANAAINQGSITRFGQYVPASAYLRAEVIASRIECQNSPRLWRGYHH